LFPGAEVYFKSVLHLTPQAYLHTINTLPRQYGSVMEEKEGEERGYYTTKRNSYISKTKVVSVKLPVALITALDELINNGYFQNRSDAIREAIRRLLTQYQMHSTRQLDTGFFVGLR